MVRFGILTDPARVADAAEAGFDYVELNLNRVLALDEDEYDRFRDTSDQYGIYPEVLSGMLPEDVHVVGPHVSAREMHACLERAFAAAKALGAEVLVFDGAAARRLPPDFDAGMAWRQMGNFVRIVQGYASSSGVRAALMPLRRAEADLLNHISEVTLISAMLQLDCVGVAASSYQMAMEAETPAVLRRTGSLLLHMRVSNALGGHLPRIGDGEDYTKLLRALREMGYKGRMSCEGPSGNFRADALAALTCMKSARARA